MNVRQRPHGFQSARDVSRDFFIQFQKTGTRFRRPYQLIILQHNVIFIPQIRSVADVAYILRVIQKFNDDFVIYRRFGFGISFSVRPRPREIVTGRPVSDNVKIGMCDVVIQTAFICRHRRNLHGLRQNRLVAVGIDLQIIRSVVQSCKTEIPVSRNRCRFKICLIINRQQDFIAAEYAVHIAIYILFCGRIIGYPETAFYFRFQRFHPAVNRLDSYIRRTGSGIPCHRITLYAPVGKIHGYIFRKGHILPGRNGYVQFGNIVDLFRFQPVQLAGNEIVNPIFFRSRVAGMVFQINFICGKPVRSVAARYFSEITFAVVCQCNEKFAVIVNQNAFNANSVLTVLTVYIAEIEFTSICQRYDETAFVVYNDCLNPHAIVSVLAHNLAEFRSRAVRICNDQFSRRINRYISYPPAVFAILSVFTVRSNYGSAIERRPVRKRKNEMPFLIDFRIGYPDTVFSRLSLLSANASAIDYLSIGERNKKFPGFIYRNPRYSDTVLSVLSVFAIFSVFTVRSGYGSAIERRPV